MLVGGMVHDEVENDADAALLGFAGEHIEVRQRPVHRIDIFVVGYVVAKIHLRRREAGRDPDRVHAEILQVIQFRGDALEVADAVVVAVGKAARIDLVEDRMLPPLVAFGIDGILGFPRACRKERNESNTIAQRRQGLRCMEGLLAYVSKLRNLQWTATIHCFSCCPKFEESVA